MSTFKEFIYMGVCDESGRINPIEWQCDNDGHCTADTEFFYYCVYQMRNGKWTGYCYEKNFGDFDTLDVIKSECQRHYEKYINSILNPSVKDKVLSFFDRIL